MRNKVTETHIVTGILQYLHYKYPKSFFWRQNTLPIPIKKKVGGKWVQAGYRKSLTPGVSDILGCHNGRMVAIEVKNGRNEASDDQVRFLEAVRSAGGIAFVAYGIEEVERGME